MNTFAFVCRCFISSLSLLPKVFLVGPTYSRRRIKSTSTNHADIMSFIVEKWVWVEGCDDVRRPTCITANTSILLKPILICFCSCLDSGTLTGGSLQYDPISVGLKLFVLVLGFLQSINRHNETRPPTAAGATVQDDCFVTG